MKTGDIYCSPTCGDFWMVIGEKILIINSSFSFDISSTDTERLIYVGNVGPEKAEEHHKAMKKISEDAMKNDFRHPTDTKKLINKRFKYCPYCGEFLSGQQTD